MYGQTLKDTPTERTFIVGNILIKMIIHEHIENEKNNNNNNI